MSKKKKMPQESIMDDAMFLQSMNRNMFDGITSDVLGSYTGTPDDEEQPVQDADDL